MSAKKKKVPAQDNNPVGYDAKVTRMPALPGRGAQPAHVCRERQRRSVFTGSMRPKREVVIYDYVDADEPLLAKMASRREAGYRALGYDVMQAGDLFLARQCFP